MKELAFAVGGAYLCMFIFVIALFFISNKQQSKIEGLEARIQVMEQKSFGGKRKPKADGYKCPVCGRYLFDKPPFCDKCGIALDWGTNDDSTNSKK